MEFDEMIEKIFNDTECLDPSKVNNIIDYIFTKENFETPFGIITGVYIKRLI